MKVKRTYKDKTYYYNVESKERTRIPSDKSFDIFFKGDHPDKRTPKEWAYKTASKLGLNVLEYRNGEEIEYIFTKGILEFYREPKWRKNKQLFRCSLSSGLLTFNDE